jgi:hypothetical protein
MTSPMEYGERVQDALRALIEKRFKESESPVRSRAELSRALGHGNARQYVASRFKPDPKSGMVRDFTLPDLLAFAEALGLDGGDLLQAARDAVDGGATPVLIEAGRRTPRAGTRKRSARAPQK